MKAFRLLFLSFVLSFTYACSHPLEIHGKGEGDILSETGQRDCLLEEHQAELENCTENLVILAYNETYTAAPRPGSQFRRWATYCGNADDNTCSFNIRAGVVRANWNSTLVKPLKAVFRPITNTGLNAVLMGNGMFDPFATGIASHALAAGFPNHVTTPFFNSVDQGAAQGFWDNVSLRGQVQSVLDVGDVDLLGMIYSPTYQTVAGYSDWINYALAQNPDTRFFIATPWGDDPGGVGSAQFETDFDAEHDDLHVLIDALRAVYPNIDFYCVPTGEGAVDLYNLYSGTGLPDVSALIGPAATSLFADGTGNPGDILVELGQLSWLAAIYGVDIPNYAYVPPYSTDLKAIAGDIADNHDALYNAPPQAFPDVDGDGIPDHYDPIDFLELLPSATGGVFQVYPGETGAVMGPATTSPSGLGPLQVLEQYSAGMDIQGSAERVILAQLADTPDEFILLASLASIDVDTLSASLTLTNAGLYQGYQLWDIAGSRLQLVGLDSRTLAVGPSTAVERALDVYAGGLDSILRGPLSPYILALELDFPNSFLYGLPALYGAVAAPGTGDNSLSQAMAVNSVFGVDGGVLSGALNFFTPNATTYTNKMLTLLTGFTAPAISGGADIASINLAGLSVDDDLRPLLKSLVHDMDSVDYTGAVALGGNTPWLNFNVGEDPNSIFINFEFIGATERTNFEAAHLPAGFTLAPLSVLDSDTPKYFLVLNIYQSSGGLVEGARAEWSVFINDPDTGVPRFLVIQAAAASVSADSVNLLTPAEPVTHELFPTEIASYVGIVDEITEIETTYFSSSISWPQAPATNVQFHREFVAANDYIFWGNAVADRGVFSASVYNREGVLIDNNEISFVDNSPWASFVNAAPVHTVVYLNPLDIVISPWWNLDAPYLDVTPAYLTTLENFHSGFYPGMVQGIAADALRGDALALTPMITADSVPTASYHFSLLDPVGLLTAVSQPGIYIPVQLKLFADAPAGHYLTLAVYKREIDACGIRAEWITYVENAIGRPTALKLDGFAENACLDPLELMTLAADVSQSINGGFLDTVISSPFTQFDASINLGLTDNIEAGLDWLESGDSVCSLNGICDKYYLDGQLLVEPVQRADSAAVQVNVINTPWDSYIDTVSVRAGVRSNPILQTTNPWRNLRSFSGAAAIP